MMMCRHFHPQRPSLPTTIRQQHQQQLRQPMVAPSPTGPQRTAASAPSSTGPAAAAIQRATTTAYAAAPAPQRPAAASSSVTTARVISPTPGLSAQQQSSQRAAVPTSTGPQSAAKPSAATTTQRTTTTPSVAASPQRPATASSVTTARVISPTPGVAAGAIGNLQNNEIEVKRLRSASGISFFNGSSPPKVERVAWDSYLLNKLFVDDQILAVNGKPISTATEFHQICNTSEKAPATLKIRFRRDSSTQILMQGLPDPRPNVRAFRLDLRWPANKGLGIITENRSGSVVISNVDPGTLMATRLKYGDIIASVNDQKVSDTNTAREKIRQSIQTTNAVALLIERNMAPVQRQPIPDDVRRLLLANNDFITHMHSRPPAIIIDPKQPVPEASPVTGGGAGTTLHHTSTSPMTAASGGQPRQDLSQKSTAKIISAVGKQEVALDDFGRPLVPTPDRVGSQHEGKPAAAPATSAEQQQGGPKQGW